MRRRDLRKNATNGECRDLNGTILIDCIYVNEICTEWQEEDRERFAGVLSAAAKRLTDEARKYDVELHFVMTHHDMLLSFRDDACLTRSYVRDFPKSLGKSSLEDVAAFLREKYGVGQVAFVFAFQKTFRAFATHCGLEGPVTNFAEFVSFPFSGNADEDITGLTHEILHLFGAVDLYYPQEISRYSVKYFRDSIMFGGDVIDPVTRYLIGWGKDFSLEAQTLFDKLESLSDEYVAQSVMSEWNCDYTESRGRYGIYCGPMKNGQRHGKGKYEGYDGKKYVGDFASGKFHGRGCYTWKGNRYSGEFCNDKFDGYGKLVWKNGAVYEGWFSNDRYHGRGELKWNGNKYRGEFSCGKFNGNGTLIWSNGSIYVGDFSNGLYEGRGALTCGKCAYVGEFRGGKFNGQGRLVSKDGTIREGVFRDNVFLG